MKRIERIHLPSVHRERIEFFAKQVNGVQQLGVQQFIVAIFFMLVEGALTLAHLYGEGNGKCE
jgi:hypothetical protein